MTPDQIYQSAIDAEAVRRNLVRITAREGIAHDLAEGKSPSWWEQWLGNLEGKWAAEDESEAKRVVAFELDRQQERIATAKREADAAERRRNEPERQLERTSGYRYCRACGSSIEGSCPHSA